MKKSRKVLLLALLTVLNVMFSVSMSFATPREPPSRFQISTIHTPRGEWMRVTDLDMHVVCYQGDNRLTPPSCVKR